MYITTDEMKSAIYQYQLEQITEDDDDIIMMAITAAEDEVKGYLRPNMRGEWRDGRNIYDVNAIFQKTGTQRNALLMEHIKSIAVWYIVRLCNVDMLYDSAKDRYDRTVKWLREVNKGDVTLDLPLIDLTATDEDGNPLPGTDRQPFRFGSRTKFNHE